MRNQFIRFCKSSPAVLTAASKAVKAFTMFLKEAVLYVAMAVLSIFGVVNFTYMYIAPKLVSSKTHEATPATSSSMAGDAKVPQAVEMVPFHGGIAGWVVDTLGRPVTKVTVRISRTGHKVTEWEGQPASDGSFVSPPLTAGQYSLYLIRGARLVDEMHGLQADGRHSIQVAIRVAIPTPIRSQSARATLIEDSGRESGQ